MLTEQVGPPRLRQGWRSVALCALVAAQALGCQASTPEPSVMPLGTVRLYETGVGYFERAGIISEDTGTLPVPASHVDDALKTLVVLSDGPNVQVAGIEFDSVMSRGLARSLAALPLDADQEVSFADVLGSLKGIDVEVVLAGEPIRGRLIEVRPAPPLRAAPPGAELGREATPPARGTPPEPVVDTEEDHFLTLVAEDGGVRRFRASQVSQLRPQDPALQSRLSAAASALSGRAAQIQRGLRVLATGGARVRLGYIAETPVWRATYRLLLADQKSAKIEGWALIHNDTDEVWRSVRVELVNGRPDSFLFPLSAPRYARRPLATPAETLSTVPQLADRTPDQIWGDHADDELSGGSTGYGSGYGSGSGRLSGSHGVRIPQLKVSTGESGEISIGNLAEIAQATGLEAGALFSYELPSQLNLRAHGSALVPFTSQTIAARRLTWFESAGEAGRSGARVSNTGSQTLPAGPVSIYEARAAGASSGFSGETGLPRLKPKERAFLRFGVDLDVELELDREVKTKPREVPQKVRFENDALVVHFVRHREVGYELRNRSGAARDVFLVLDVVKNAKVEGADELDYDLESETALAVFKVAPGATVKRRLQLKEALSRTTPAAALTSKAIIELSQEADLPEAERRALVAAAPLIKAVEQAEQALTDGKREVTRLSGELERMQEHLKALGDKSGSPAGANPLVVRILDLEDRLSRAERQVETLTTQVTDRGKLVKEHLKALGADVPVAGEPAN